MREREWLQTAECTSYPQAVALAEAADWAVFVPELWWRRNKDWAERTQELPGLGDYRHELRLGWNDRIAKRRPEISRLINQFGGGDSVVREVGEGRAKDDRNRVGNTGSTI